MKRLMILISVSAVFFSLAFIFIKFRPISEKERLMQSPAYRYAEEYRGKHGEKENGEEQEKETIRQAMEYLAQMRNNPNTGTIDPADVYRARNQAKQLRANKNQRGLPLNLTWENLGPDNVGGRTRGFMFDKNNPDHLLAGGVSGGLFYSDDMGLSWHPHPSNAEMGHLGISTIRQASNGDIYVGTGEPFTYADGTTANSAFIGEGIYKSTDGGQTFSHLASTTPTTANSQGDAWSIVSEIAIDPNDPQKVYASTAGGLKISTDGGATWVNPTGIGTPVTAASGEVAVAPNGTVVAEINRKYYRSTDGITFTNLTGTGGFPSSGIARIEFTISPEDANYIYCIIANGNVMNGIFRSTDNGLTWTSLIRGNSQAFNVLGEQGTYDIAFGVDPKNKNKFFVGGQLELWSYNDGGWNQVAYWIPEGPTNPYYVHADMHGIFFHPTDNNIMFVICDGGIFKTTNSTQQFPTYTMRNKGYITTQFYGIGISDEGLMIGGAQDNGTQVIDLEGNTRQAALYTTTANYVAGGDGGDADWSGINPLAVFASTYDAKVYRSSNGGGYNSFSVFYDNNIDRDNDGSIDQGSLFVLPTYLWEQDNSNTVISGNDTTVIEDQRSVYFVGASTKLWFTPDALNFSGQPYWYEIEASGTVSEIEVSPDGTIFFGTNSGNVYKVTGLAAKYLPIDTIDERPTYHVIKYGTDFPKPSRLTTTNPDGWDFPSTGGTYKGLTRTTIGTSQSWGGGRYVAGIGVDPHNINDIVLSLGNYGFTNYVYLSTNGGTTFSPIQNNLPPMPVYDAIIDYYNPNNIILATELGIWASTDFGQVWQEENGGMVSVPTFEIFQRQLYDSDCKILYASTYGRGIYRSTTLTPNGCNLVAGIKDNATPTSVSLMQVYPNPVSDKAMVEFEMKEINTPVNLLVVDLLGRAYKNEKLSDLRAGANKIEVNFNDMATGVYLVTLQTGKASLTKRVFVTK